MYKDQYILRLDMHALQRQANWCTLSKKNFVT